MAISTYSELQTTLSKWLVRDGDSDFAERMPDFIALFEADFLIDPLNRYRQMEIRAEATLDPAGDGGGRYIGLPSAPDAFIEMRDIRITSTNPETPLSYATPAYLTQVWGNTQAARPALYTIIGDEIRFAPIADAAYTLEMVFYQFDKLSGENPTNWLLTSYPNLYLYGSLLQAEAYLQNDARVPAWKALRDEAVAKLRMSDTQARWSGPIQRRSTYAV
jgi:hypothetical protein